MRGVSEVFVTLCVFGLAGAPGSSAPPRLSAAAVCVSAQSLTLDNECGVLHSCVCSANVSVC